MANYFLNDVELSQYLLLLGDPKAEHTNSMPSSSAAIDCSCGFSWGCHLTA